MEDNRNVKNKDGARVIGGLILVGVGAALFIRNMGYIDLPYWLFTWPMILILVGIYSGFKHNFSNTGWIIMIAVGGFFLVDDFMPNIKLEPAFWPLVIVGFGILFIIRPRKKNGRQDWGYLGKGNREEQATQGMKSYDHPSDYTNSANSDKSDYLRIDSVFSGVNRTILSKNFQGGRISCVFGGAEVDMMQADFAGKVIIKMDVVFGGLKLRVPANWNVMSEIDGAFHSVDDKRRNNQGMPSDPNKVLILKGSCVFGGIDIKSY
ncbi:MAG: DUF5668 domain-containing protein [Ferruginibacter sp.]